jgi:hypothetical protein
LPSHLLRSQYPPVENWQNGSVLSAFVCSFMSLGVSLKAMIYFSFNVRFSDNVREKGADKLNPLEADWKITWSAG